jgi:hypothetical protein
VKVTATCLPLSNGSFLDFKTEPTHCNHIRTAKHKIDQISSVAQTDILLSQTLDAASARRTAPKNKKAGRGNRDRPSCDGDGLCR